ncbi:single-stranded DNA-binding protein [Mesorhizobium sp. B2-2-4]|nr:single-stranded DNA-binding protein [Mesorhizobium sp. B2-2-4]TPM62391.1 single-stranded DNA-binding protein [Mesorhizobium sp. B2-2-1]TPN68771.1 single-stranded DNA-binding protein [Mesorhizobium sp. B1-1-3]
MTRPASIDADVDGIQSIGQASTSVVEQAGRAMAARQSTAVTPMEMLDRALANGASLETVEKLMDLQERWEANQARKAFTEAFAAFKSEVITIVRNREVTDGPLKGRRYAELFSFVDAVTPALSKHDLTATWNITRDEKDWIEVTCTIEHVLGHCKRVPMGGPPDTGGAKNPIQARASTVTYLERHTLKAACGLAEQGDDKDGNISQKGPSGPITDAQRDTLLALIEETGTDVVKFCEWAKIEAVSDLLARHFDKAVGVLQARKEKAA